jgi:hypothetical protein
VLESVLEDFDPYDPYDPYDSDEPYDLLPEEATVAAWHEEASRETRWEALKKASGHVEPEDPEHSGHPEGPERTRDFEIPEEPGTPTEGGTEDPGRGGPGTGSPR